MSKLPMRPEGMLLYTTHVNTGSKAHAFMPADRCERCASDRGLVRCPARVRPLALLIVGANGQTCGCETTDCTKLFRIGSFYTSVWPRMSRSRPSH